MTSSKFTYEVSGEDFTHAGEASGSLKRSLKQIGFDADVIRRVSIAMYEAEINMVIHADGGTITAEVFADKIDLTFDDQGPGIPDVDKAMQEGFSTAPDNVRSLGFGAGMGLPNIKKYTDEMNIETQIGVGTKLFISIHTVR